MHTAASRGFLYVCRKPSLARSSLSAVYRLVTSRLQYGCSMGPPCCTCHWCIPRVRYIEANAGTDGCISVRIYLYLQRGRSSPLGFAPKKTLDKGKSFSSDRYRSSYGAIDPVVDSILVDTAIRASLCSRALTDRVAKRRNYPSTR